MTVTETVTTPTNEQIEAFLNNYYQHASKKYLESKEGKQDRKKLKKALKESKTINREYKKGTILKFNSGAYEIVLDDAILGFNTVSSHECYSFDQGHKELNFTPLYKVNTCSITNYSDRLELRSKRCLSWWRHEISPFIVVESEEEKEKLRAFFEEQLTEVEDRLAKQKSVLEEVKTLVLKALDQQTLNLVDKS